MSKGKGFESSSISLKFTVTKPNDDNEDDIYGAFTYIKAKVLRGGSEKGTGASKAIGEISGVSINRQKIPEDCFWEAFDMHSGELEWVGGALLENKLGRTKLQSLINDDDPEFNFFLIQQFSIDEDQPCDVATYALHRFLYSDEIKGTNPENTYGCWVHSSVAYVLDEIPGTSNEDGSGTNKRKRDEASAAGISNTAISATVYKESIPFLRNGFFQDAALVRKDSDNARILIGGISHFTQDLKSEAEAIKKAKALLGGSPNGKLSGKDAEILSRVVNLVNENDERSMRTVDIASIMTGLATYKPPEDCTSQKQLKSLQNDLTRMVQSGGSIARSMALHAACEKNSIKVVELLLQMDKGSSRSKNHLGRSPLVVAAINAAGRLSINGIDDTAVIDALLASGANKGETDSTGMTAYGYFKKSSDMHLMMTHYQHRRKITNLEHKLYPPGGPTQMDFAGGTGGNSGFVDYGPEDDEADREMGRGAYAKYNEDDYGDY